MLRLWKIFIEKGSNTGLDDHTQEVFGLMQTRATLSYGWVMESLDRYHFWINDAQNLTN